jgi:ATP-dependent Clp protease ATP-binding subunit ClpA
VFYFFTDRARRAVVLAARSRGPHDAVITPDHLLAGLLQEGEGMAAVVLNQAGLRLEDLLHADDRGGRAVELSAARQLLESTLGVASPTSPAMSREAQAILDGAMNQARMLGHRYVGTEHLLLALLAASPVVSGLADLDHESLRRSILERAAPIQLRIEDSTAALLDVFQRWHDEGTESPDARDAVVRRWLDLNKAEGEERDALLQRTAESMEALAAEAASVAR